MTALDRIVTDPERPASFPDDILRALYDLSPAETEVANGLLMGYSPEEIGCLRRVSAGTIRQQIKSMLSNTGTNRRSEMVRLLMRLPRCAQMKSDTVSRLIPFGSCDQRLSMATLDAQALVLQLKDRGKQSFLAQHLPLQRACALLLNTEAALGVRLTLQTPWEGPGDPCICLW